MKTVQYTPRCGTHIDDVSRIAWETANLDNCRVAFTFNGIDLTVEPTDNPDTAAKWYEAECKVRAAAYRASEAGRAAAAARVARLASAQKTLDALIADMGDMSDPKRAVAFVRDLASVADDVGLVWNKKSVARRLKSAGWVASANRGNAFRADDRENVAGWIVGQALSMMRNGMPPHPMLADFAEKWLAGG